jgi:hypothetical protein
VAHTGDIGLERGRGNLQDRGAEPTHRRMPPERGHPKCHNPRVRCIVETCRRSAALQAYTTFHNAGWDAWLVESRTDWMDDGMFSAGGPPQSYRHQAHPTQHPPRSYHPTCHHPTVPGVAETCRRFLVAQTSTTSHQAAQLAGSPCRLNRSPHHGPPTPVWSTTSDTPPRTTSVAARLVTLTTTRVIRDTPR